MTADYRDLITRMAKELDEYRQLLLDDRTVTHRLSDEARAALAEEPAVPEGRYTRLPSDEELRDLWSWAAGQDQGSWPTQQHCFARAVLARWGNPAPEPLAGGGVVDDALALFVESQRPMDPEFAGILTPGVLWSLYEGTPAPASADEEVVECAAELLQRRALVPVSVAERPWEREGWCDAEGNCWLSEAALDGSTPMWIYGPVAWAERFPKLHRTLLPTHALPIPQQQESDNG